MVRKTKQRDAIEAVIDAARHPLSIEQILDGAQRRCDGVGIATVYRTVNALAEQGKVTVVEIAGESPLYERAGLEHHHHFRCDTCDEVYDIHACLENLQALLPTKFRLKGHDVTLYGVCARCAT